MMGSVLLNDGNDDDNNDNEKQRKKNLKFPCTNITRTDFHDYIDIDFESILKWEEATSGIKHFSHLLRFHLLSFHSFFIINLWSYMFINHRF